nr:7TM GPCR domain containing protein [Haemonchus contortus]
MIVLCLFGVVGNSLSLYIYTRPAFRKRSINILLSALSAADLSVCVLSIPVFSSSHLQLFLPISERTIAVFMFYAYPITVMFQSMSVWLLVSITVDRYLAMCHPFEVGSYCTRSRALMTVLLIVVFSVAYNFVRFWEFQIMESSAESLEAIVQPLLRDSALFMLWYQNIATLLSQFVLPLLVLCILNLQVARTILMATEQRRELVASEKREHNTAKMMIFVVIVFLVCYTFSFILNVAEILFSALFRHPIGYLLNDINNILVVVNTSSPFVFYIKYSTRYRNQLRTVYGIRWAAARFKFYDRKPRRSHERLVPIGARGKVAREGLNVYPALGNVVIEKKRSDDEAKSRKS